MKTLFSVNLPVVFFLYWMLPALGALDKMVFLLMRKIPTTGNIKNNRSCCWGGSKDDNLFQIDHLVDHLDLMEQTGANYVRNTMSSRDKGNLRAFKRLSDGRYDLDQVESFILDEVRKDAEGDPPKERFLFRLNFWDQHDYNRGRWDDNPGNPRQNV